MELAVLLRRCLFNVGISKCQAASRLLKVDNAKGMSPQLKARFPEDISCPKLSSSPQLRSKSDLEAPAVNPSHLSIHPSIRPSVHASIHSSFQISLPCTVLAHGVITAIESPKRWNTYLVIVSIFNENALTSSERDRNIPPNGKSNHGIQVIPTKLCNTSSTSPPV